MLVDPTYVKAYSRKALSLQNLGKLSEALEVITVGLRIEPSNADLTKLQATIVAQQQSNSKPPQSATDIALAKQKADALKV